MGFLFSAKSVEKVVPPTTLIATDPCKKRLLDISTFMHDFPHFRCEYERLKTSFYTLLFYVIILGNYCM